MKPFKVSYEYIKNLTAFTTFPIEKFFEEHTVFHRKMSHSPVGMALSEILESWDCGMDIPSHEINAASRTIADFLESKNIQLDRNDAVLMDEFLCDVRTAISWTIDAHYHCELEEFVIGHMMDEINKSGASHYAFVNRNYITVETIFEADYVAFGFVRDLITDDDYEDELADDSVYGYTWAYDMINNTIERSEGKDFDHPYYDDDELISNFCQCTSRFNVETTNEN